MHVLKEVLEKETLEEALEKEKLIQVLKKLWVDDIPAIVDSIDFFVSEAREIGHRDHPSIACYCVVQMGMKDQIEPLLNGENYVASMIRILKKMEKYQ